MSSLRPSNLIPQPAELFCVSVPCYYARKLLQQMQWWMVGMYFTLFHGWTHTRMQIALNTAVFMRLLSVWSFKCNIQVITEMVGGALGMPWGVFITPPRSPLLSVPWIAYQTLAFHPHFTRCGLRRLVGFDFSLLFSMNFPFNLEN